MKDELNIPLLQDLVSRGQPDTGPYQSQLDTDENLPLEIEQEAIEVSEDRSYHIQKSEVTQSGEHLSTIKSDQLTEDASVTELIIDEEIRMILDKHMDNAYEEIIRLLNHRIT